MNFIFSGDSNLKFFAVAIITNLIIEFFTDGLKGKIIKVIACLNIFAIKIITSSKIKEKVE